MAFLAKTLIAADTLHECLASISKHYINTDKRLAWYNLNIIRDANQR